MENSQTQSLTETQPGVPFQEVILLGLVIVAGAMLAINLMPLWLPWLSYSTAGDTPKVFWFLSRGSAIAAYWICWLSMGMGIIITNKMAQRWPGIPPAYEIHQYTSLLGIGFGLFHALILTGDRYIGYTIPQVLVPFLGQNYRPLWVGIGQTGFYLWVLVTLSFYVRKRIGQKAWRWFHFVSYASFLAAMAHGIFAGTDTVSPWMQAGYWISGAGLLFLTMYRVMFSIFPAPTPRPPAPARGRGGD